VIGVSLIAALTVLPIVGAPRMRYDLSARVEGRYREPGNERLEQEQQGDPNTPAQQVIRPAPQSWDLDTEATARVAVVWRRGRFGVSYGPRYAITGIFENPTRSLLHRGDALLTLRFPRVELAFSEYASYGEISYASPLTVQDQQASVPPSGMMPPGMTTPPGGVQIARLQPIPAATELAYVSSDSTVTSMIRTSRQTRLTLTTSYSVSGGTDEPSRATLPLAQTGRGVASYEVTATHRDTLTSSLEGSHVLTKSVAPRAPIEGALPLPPSAFLPLLGGRPPITTTILRVGEAWQRRWTRTATSTLGGGIEVIPNSDLDGATHVYPYGSALYMQTWAAPAHSRLAASAGLFLSTLVDRLTGYPDQRWQASADLTWTRRPWTLRAAASHSDSVDAHSPNPLRLTTFELTGAYDLTRMLTLESGLRMFRQVYTQPQEEEAPMAPMAPVAPAATRPLRPESLRTIVFVALTFHLGERDF
jgi:hypothetical protein